MKARGGKDATSEFVARFPRGAFIFREGDVGREMYIVQEGAVEILTTHQGQEERLALLEEGDFFGEMAMLEELPRTASARAVRDCVLVRIDRGAFDQLIRHNPEISIRMLRKLCHRLRTMELRGPLETPQLPQVGDTVVGPGPYLLHTPSGTRFPLAADGMTTIGRRDAATGLVPVVDLASLDPGRTTSRRHARLFRREGQWFLVEEVGVTNGTFCNKRRLAAGEEHPIASGDRLRFGMVELEFHHC